jgi:uncharacterized membrane protein
MGYFGYMEREKEKYMKLFFSSYFVSLFILLAIDAIWLSIMGKGFYKEQIGHLMAKDVVWGAALLFYLIYALGLTVLVIYPLVQTTGCPMQSLWKGALFGFTAYATYDLTNMATLKNWPVLLVFVDLVWGTILTGGSSFITFMLIKHIFKMA